VNRCRRSGGVRPTVQEVDRGRTWHDHPHVRGEPLDPTRVRQRRHRRSEQLVASLQRARERDRAAHAGAQLQDLDLHRDDTREHDAQNRNPGAPPDQSIE
jgi:hypothetical protein